MDHLGFGEPLARGLVQKEVLDLNGCQKATRKERTGHEGEQIKSRSDSPVCRSGIAIACAMRRRGSRGYYYYLRDEQNEAAADGDADQGYDDDEGLFVHPIWQEEVLVQPQLTVSGQIAILPALEVEDEGD